MGMGAGVESGGGVGIGIGLPPLMPSAAPPAASAFQPKNVGQDAASRVYVRG